MFMDMAESVLEVIRKSPRLFAEKLIINSIHKRNYLVGRVHIFLLSINVHYVL